MRWCGRLLGVALLIAGLGQTGPAQARFGRAGGLKATSLKEEALAHGQDDSALERRALLGVGEPYRFKSRPAPGSVERLPKAHRLAQRIFSSVSPSGQECLNHIQRAGLNAFNHLLDRYKGKVALFDVVTGCNIGDNLLWLGAKRVLTHFFHTPEVLCHALASQGDPFQTTFRECPNATGLLDALGNNSIIFYHAGGNFGDIWRHVQEFRLKLLQDLDYALVNIPKYAAYDVIVVQLPQSVHYSNETWLEHDKTMLGNLQRLKFELMVRAATSVAAGQALELKKPVIAVPDLGYMVGPTPNNYPARVDVLVLVRADGESKVQRHVVRELAGRVLMPMGLTYEIDDWSVDYPWYYPGQWRPENDGNAVQPMYGDLAEVRLQSGIRVLAQGRVVVCNRLHATILAQLIGKPTWWIDGEVFEGYGKIEQATRMARGHAPHICSDAALKSYHVKNGTELQSFEMALAAAGQFVKRTLALRAQGQNT